MHSDKAAVAFMQAAAQTVLNIDSMMIQHAESFTSLQALSAFCCNQTTDRLTLTDAQLCAYSKLTHKT